MKKIFSILNVVLCIGFAQAQITVDQNDMPTGGDTIRVSLGDITQPVDLITTGAGQVWDFSSLQWISQTVDTFLNLSQTPANYQIYYANVPFNTNRANVAIRASLPVPPVPGITISDVYGFYYKSSSSYKQVGYGANINGFDTPVAFNNKDFIYNFPLNFGAVDSSDSDLSFSIPSVGYYGMNQHRVNYCDGWGTLITPFGSFPVLRVLSIMAAHDTIYVDQAGTGFGIDRPLQREYKWIGKNQSIPLLQINTTVTFGSENVTSIRYRDIARDPLSVHEILPAVSMNLNPNPASDYITVIFENDKSEIRLLSVTDVSGRTIGRYKTSKNSFRLDLKNYKSGIYFLMMQGRAGEMLSAKRFVIE